MVCPTIITILLLGILRIQWSTAALSRSICIDRVSSFIATICNGCLRITLLPSRRYSEINTKRAMNAEELLYALAEKCCYEQCSVSYLRSFCCNTQNSELLL